MMEKRILLNRTSETVLRFLPPYILQREHVDIAIAALDEILTEHAPALATGAAAQPSQSAGGR
jgi:acetylornithine aminotransferase/acetylornithine/N-succinyldiaminopimelate aminotransferase